MIDGRLRKTIKEVSTIINFVITGDIGLGREFVVDGMLGNVIEKV